MDEYLIDELPAELPAELSVWHVPTDGGLAEFLIDDNVDQIPVSGGSASYSGSKEPAGNVALAEILGRTKYFKYITLNADPLVDDVVAATNIVKKFIVDNDLIIYGGLAIDYAARLCGDKLYDDATLKVPDLDFYSPANVSHSYTLADIICQAGYKNVRAIMGTHMGTMRIDLDGNRWLADISYRPPNVFKAIPYLTFDGARFVHPDFQRLDVHSSLAFPYDDPPREVVFARWSKDITRFGLIQKHYPIKMPAAASMLPTRKMTVRLCSSMIAGFASTGFLGYAMLYQAFSREMTAIGAAVPAEIIRAELELGGNRDCRTIIFDTLEQKCEIVHYDLSKAAMDLGIGVPRQYEPYINMIPERLEGKSPVLSTGSNGVEVVVYSVKNRLVGVNSICLGDSISNAAARCNFTARFTNIQYLMKHFLAAYFVARDATPKLAAAYMARYCSMLAMISAYESAAPQCSVVPLPTTMEPMPKPSVIYPSVDTYGNDNLSAARLVTLNRVANDLHNVPLYKVPINYYPARSQERGMGHPPFDYSLEFFQESGAEIKK